MGWEKVGRRRTLPLANFLGNQNETEKQYVKNIKNNL
jgi:hypothetical protein